MDVVQEGSDIDVFPMFNSKWGYVTCDVGVLQCLYCTFCRFSCDDFTLGDLTSKTHAIRLMKDYRVGDFEELNVMLGFEEQISGIVGILV